MKKITFILSIILLVTVSAKSYSNENVYIVYSINNILITNVDLKKESKYLIALNSQLKKLDQKKILKIAEESILRETIKKIELDKYFNLEQKNPLVEDYIKNFYQRLNLKNDEEFEEYLKNYGLSIDTIRKKIQIEITWNRLVYDKYKNQLKIDKKKILQEVNLNKNKANEKIYLLSEIVFEIDSQDNLANKRDNINKSIKEIGFENSANIYSISDSSKFGGEIGWIAEKQLSKKIFSKINILKIGEHTNPINAGSSFLILKINNIKYEKKITNINQEVEKKIQFETDRQLSQYSKIYYNKVKINTNINEL